MTEQKAKRAAKHKRRVGRPAKMPNRLVEIGYEEFDEFGSDEMARAWQKTQRALDRAPPDANVKAIRKIIDRVSEASRFPGALRAGVGANERALDILAHVEKRDGMPYTDRLDAVRRCLQEPGRSSIKSALRPRKPKAR